MNTPPPMVDPTPPPEAELWALPNIAAHTGKATSTVRHWWLKRLLPDPVTTRGQGRRLGWPPDTIRNWWKARSQLLGPGAAARMAGISVATLRKRRDRGQWPAPDTDPRQSPGWRPDTITAHLETEARAAAEARAARTPPPPPPPPQWTQTETQTVWQLSETDLADLITDLGPAPWPVPTLNKWRRGRHQQLLNDPTRLLSKQIADHTGLSWETVRTYRRLGHLPPPDGQHKNHPWWHTTTINTWNTTRRKSTGGRPRGHTAAVRD